MNAMATKSNNIKLAYDSDADVLSIENDTNSAIDHAKEMGSLVVHFSKNNEPVLIEVLEASHTLRGQTKPLQEVVTAAR